MEVTIPVDISQLQWFIVGKPVQDAVELEWFLHHFVEGKHSVLEIGCADGGMLVAMAQRLVAPPMSEELKRVFLPSPVVRGISLPADAIESILLTNTMEALRRNHPDSYVATADSRSSSAISWAAQWAPYDVVFIDGDHSYEGVRADWENYGSMGKVVAFHDIADCNLGTKRFWEELKEGRRTVEYRADPHGYKGIGVVIKES